MQFARGFLLALAVATVGGCALGKSKSDQSADALDRGLQAHVEGRVDEATQAYRTAIEHDPSNKYAYYNLGVVDAAAGRADAAENNYRLALRVDPAFAPALYNLAILRNTAGYPQEAIALYRQAIAAQPDYPEAHLNLGFALLEIGATEEGNAELARAVELNPALASRIPTPPADPPPASQ